MRHGFYCNWIACERHMQKIRTTNLTVWAYGVVLCTTWDRAGCNEQLIKISGELILGRLKGKENWTIRLVRKSMESCVFELLNRLKSTGRLRQICYRYLRIGQWWRGSRACSVRCRRSLLHWTSFQRRFLSCRSRFLLQSWNTWTVHLLRVTFLVILRRLKCNLIQRC